jgi:riboflavin kinase/FMN adenylyltransferase
MNFIAPVDTSLIQNAWVTIGSFDGVHLGHQALVKSLITQARAEGSPAVVLTFWPHPATFFKRAPLAWALTSPEERKALLCALGVDEVLTLDFTQELANLTALEFMQGLKDRLGLKGLLVGPNFALGKGREGSVQRLAELARELDFKLEVAQPVMDGDGMISSSQIRTDLLEGRVTPAAHKLGRLYNLRGKVVHGEHRGTGLGVPTANLEHQSERLVPGNGVYITLSLIHISEPTRPY